MNDYDLDLMMKQIIEHRLLPITVYPRMAARYEAYRNVGKGKKLRIAILTKSLRK